MPLIIFILMYIVGIMLGYIGESNLPDYRLNAFFRVVMFMKVKKKTFCLHALIFQILNIALFAVLVILHVILAEKITLTVYNIYKWISLMLFVSAMITAALDAAILERNGKGIKHENN